LNNSLTNIPFSNGAIDQRCLNLISGIYDLPLSPERWSPVLDEFTSIMGGAIAGVAAYDPIYIDHHLNKATSNYTEELKKTVSDNFQAKNGYKSAFAKMATNPKRGFINDLEMLELDSIEKYGERPHVKWLLENLGVFRGSASCLNIHKAWTDILFIMYPYGRGPMSYQENIIGELFLDHFAKTVEIGRSFTVLKNRFNSVFASLDRMHIGVFLLSATGSIIHQNMEARRILDAGDGISLSRGGYLYPVDESSREIMKDAVSKAAATAQARHNCAETILSLARTSGLNPYLVEISPLRDNDEIESQFSGCLVYIIDPDKTDIVSTEGMDALYNLTGTESEICKMLAEGLETDDIAESRNITRETVRNTVKQILQKTGACNRTQLVRLALRVNLPIDSASDTDKQP